MTVTLDSLTYQPGNTADVTHGQMVAVVFAGPRPPAYPRDKIERIAAAWCNVSDEFGFPRSHTWGQSGHETGWFWSRTNVNQVKPEQHNWGGLGADNSGAAGATFGPVDGYSAEEHGALAFMCHRALYVFGPPDLWPQHLRKYAKYAYRLAAVRWAHNTVKKPDGSLLRHLGTVKRIRDFVNGRWARTDTLPLGTLQNGYSTGIVDKANQVHAQPREETPMGTPYEHVISGLEDVRHLLKRNPRGGSEGRMALGHKHGAVIHFNGPDVSATDDRRFIIDVIAPYHAQKDFSRAGDGSAVGDGIMYHVGIGRHGEKFLMRDLEAGLWHSGSNWNNHSLALFFPIGINQRATPAALQAAREVLDDWRRFTKGSREQVKGHLELSSTNCPGTLMADLVRPYRAGSDAPVIVEPGPAPATPRAQLDPWRFDEAAKNYAAAWNKGQPFWVLDPFVDWLLQRGGLATMGYVTSGAFVASDTGLLTQFFECGALEWHPQNPPAHRVLRRHTGLEVLRVRYPERVPA